MQENLPGQFKAINCQVCTSLSIKAQATSLPLGSAQASSGLGESKNFPLLPDSVHLGSC